MKWYEVHPSLEEGEKACRESTPNKILHFSEECKVFMMEDTNVEYNVFNPSTVVYCPTTSDLCANDWKIIEDVPEMKLFRATVGYCPHCGSLQICNWDIDDIVTNCGNCRKPSRNKIRDNKNIIEEYKSWLSTEISDIGSSPALSGPLEEAVFRACLLKIEKLERGNQNE
jgi:hypothetical protein